jgi:hypothetical protein
VIGILKFSVVTKQEVLTPLKLPIYKIFELDRFCIQPEYYSNDLYEYILSKIGNFIKNDFPSIKVLALLVDDQTDLELIYKQSNWQTLTDHNNIMNQQATKLNMDEQEYEKFLCLTKIRIPNTRWYIHRL